MLIAATSAAHFITISQPPGARMLAFCATVFLSMKFIVQIEAGRNDGVFLHLVGWIQFVLLWPGMRPIIFAAPRSPQKGATGVLLGGAARIAAGFSLCWLARYAWNHWPIAGPPHFIVFLLVCVFLIGISLVLHFGVFNIATAAWRFYGINAPVLFRKPASSKNLAEFWSRRWNTAYSEMMTQAVYRPANTIAGRDAATWSVFLISGFLHEIAISLPVSAGYGLPTGYFLLQALFIKLEESVALKGPWAKLYTFAAILLPAPLLFHAPFVRGVVLPLLH